MKINWKTDEERNQLMKTIFVKNFNEFEKILKQRHLEDWENALHSMDFYTWVVFFAHAYLYGEEE